MDLRKRLKATVTAFRKKRTWTTGSFTEALLLQHVTAFVETAGGLVVRQAYATHGGVSDLIVCYAGRFIALELKGIGGVPTKQQLHFVDATQRSGGIAGICYSVSDVYRLLSCALDENVDAEK